MTVARTTHHFQHIIWTGLHFFLITVAEIPTIVKVLLGGYYTYQLPFHIGLLLSTFCDIVVAG